jgi:hypothetical protein
MTLSYSRLGGICVNRGPNNKRSANRIVPVLAIARLLAISAVFIAWTGVVTTLVAEDHPPLLLDLSQLKLKVSSLEVVDSVCNTSLECVTHNEGENRLVVVTLSGVLAKPSMVSLQANDFAATPADANFWRTSERSVAVNVTGFWVLTGEKQGILAAPQKTGPITIKVAFLLKANTSEFFVSYPAVAEGRARVVAAETKR